MTKSEALAWIADIFEEPPDHVQESTPRLEIAGWDSLGILSLMAELDERFDIHLSETDIGDMATVGDILKLLRDKNVLEDE